LRVHHDCHVVIARKRFGKPDIGPTGNDGMGAKKEEARRLVRISGPLGCDFPSPNEEVRFLDAQWGCQVPQKKKLLPLLNGR
jgi:hypothetical protein